MAISEEQKEELKSRIDIADLFSEYGHQLKQNGSGVWCCCPFHSEKTPSCKIDSSRGMYHCFGCGKSGDIIDFVMESDGLSFREALHKLAERAGITLDEHISPMQARRQRLLALMSELSADFNLMLKKARGAEVEAARAYLKSRALDGEITDEFLIGYAPKQVDKILAWAKKHNYSEQELATAGIIKTRRNDNEKPYFYFGGRLLFSIKDKNGRVVAFSGRLLEEGAKGIGKYVNSPETPIFKKSHTLFAFDKARSAIVKAANREVIVCEGQIDCIRLHTNGFKNVVAPLGTAFTESHAAMLHRVADSALLCFDDDTAGHKASIKTARLLLAEGMPVRIAALPDGDDPDSYIRKHGGQSFGELIKHKTESVAAFQIRVARTTEENPQSPEALVRVAKAATETISYCKSQVMREALLKEAAKILDVDVSALSAEIKISVAQQAAGNKEEAEKFVDITTQVPQANRLPTVAEASFIAFLLENEGNKEIKNIISNFLPEFVFYSPLTAGFAQAYCSDSPDAIRDYIENTPENFYRKMVSILAESGAMGEFNLPIKNKILYFAKQIWHDHLAFLYLSPEENSFPIWEKEIKENAARFLKEMQFATPKEFSRLVKIIIAHNKHRAEEAQHKVVAA